MNVQLTKITALLAVFTLFPSMSYSRTLKKNQTYSSDVFFCKEDVNMTRVASKLTHNGYESLRQSPPNNCYYLKEGDYQLRFYAHCNDLRGINDGPYSNDKYQVVKTELYSVDDNSLKHTGYAFIADDFNLVRNDGPMSDEMLAFQTDYFLNKFDNIGTLGQSYIMDDQSDITTDPYSIDMDGLADTYDGYWNLPTDDGPSNDQQTPADLVGGKRAT